MRIRKWMQTVGFLLSSSASTEICELVLRRRAVISGFLLGIVGINVFDSIGQPVPGAIVSANGQAVGLTGVGFGSPGYAPVLLPAGAYTLDASANGLTGSTPLTVNPLGIHNADIDLNGVYTP